MKIAIIGAGGVGGYFGARLAAAGEDVTFIARGAHLEAMRRDGLQVLSELGNLNLKPAKAESDPARVGQVDIVLFAVKLWSTEEAAIGAKPLMGPDTGIISFQNGVDAVDVLTRVLGEQHVMGGVAHIAALIEKPGVIRHNGQMARLTFGELDGSKSPRAQKLHAACQRAKIESYLVDDIQRVIWEKFVFLVGLSGMTSLTRMPIGPIREDRVTRELLREVMGEVVAVARAKGVHLPADVVDRQMKFADGVPADMVSSMLGDLKRGNRLEVEWLSGAVARLGLEAQMPTPINRTIYAALRFYAEGAASH